MGGFSTGQAKLRRDELRKGDVASPGTGLDGLGRRTLGDTRHKFSAQLYDGTLPNRHGHDKFRGAVAAGRRVETF
jgi:hypothetical protein